MALVSLLPVEGPGPVLLRAGGALLLGLVLTTVAWRRCVGLTQPAPPFCKSFSPLAIVEVLLVYLALWIGTSTLATKLSGSDATIDESTSIESVTGDRPQNTDGETKVATSTVPSGDAGDALTPSEPQAPKLDILTGFVVISITNLLTVLYIITRNRQQGGRLGDLGIRKAPLPQIIAFTIAMYVAFLPLAYGIGNSVDAIYATLGTTPPQQEAVKALQTDPDVFGNGLFILGVCLLTPVLEEIIFRGFLYGLLRRFMAMTPAIVTSAVLFGLLHDARVAMVLMLGGFLAFLYEKTGTILAPILCHVMHNSLTILVLRLQG